MTQKDVFLKIAGELNRNLRVTPLLYGSLGLQQRLQTDLHPDDIDILIPEVFLGEQWNSLVDLMRSSGFSLQDLHEHAFEKDGLTVAFASLESLPSFAGTDLSGIPQITESGARYLLPDLPDWLNIYRASQKDGYRQEVREKTDGQKIALILHALKAGHSRTSGTD